MAPEKVLCVLSALLYTVLCASGTSVFYVRPATSDTCPGHPCLLLSDYTHNTEEYFTSDANFLFLEGEHDLTDLLVLDNITNLTLSGVSSKVTIVMSAEAGVSCTNSQAIVMSSLMIEYRGKVKEGTHSALLFSNSHSVLIADVHLTGFNEESNDFHAISFNQSTGRITNCSFISCHGQYGSAIYVSSSEVYFAGTSLYANNTVDSTGAAIHAEDSTLTFNGSHHFLGNEADACGGAIYAVTSIIHFNGDTVMYFDHNSADEGGAICLEESDLTSNANVTFLGNSAGEDGGGVFAFNSNMKLMRFTTFTSNGVGILGGGLFMQNSLLVCNGTTTFTLNKGGSDTTAGGGLCAFNAVVRLSGNVCFKENKATFGGGMLIDGTSQLVLKSPIRMNFDGNIAHTYGAALTFEESDAYIHRCFSIPLAKNCILKAEVTNSSTLDDIYLNFTNNYSYDNDTNTAVFGGDLEHCEMQVNDKYFKSNGFQFLKNVSTFTPGGIKGSISSQAMKVCFCKNGTPDCNGESSKDISIVPGRLFNVSLVIVGELDIPVYSILTSVTTVEYLPGFAEVRIQNPRLSATCTNISFKIFAEKERKIRLYPYSCFGTDLTLNFNPDPCPGGFTPMGKQCQCQPKLTDLDRNITCDVDTGLVSRPDYSWMKPILDENLTYHGFIWCPVCSKAYCKPGNRSHPVWLNFSTNDTDNQCTENRVGTLCGRCKQNHSLILYTLECKVCSNMYTSLLLFFLAAGIGLIALLLTLHMTVAAGAINGLILYANIVNVHRDLFLPRDKTGVSPLSIFIAWVNLDFGIPTCFYDGLDAYWYAWLQYAFPLYLWLLIGIIICATNCSVRVGRLLGSNPVAVLATVVLMSYTKLLQTTVAALQFKTLMYHGSSQSFYSDGLRVWLFDGNITYFEGKHIILAIFGICFLSFLILPYIFLLLFGYRLQAYSGRKGFFWFNKFKPILDAYYAPYNSKNRYWPGFMLLVRGGVFLSSILIADTTNLLVVSSLFMAIGLVPWLRYPVYEKLYLDLLEASFILNIGILASATHHVKTVEGNQVLVTYMSVTIALAEFLGILIFHLCLRIKGTSCFQEWGCVKWLGTIFESRRNRTTYQLLNDTAAAAAPNMPPTRTFVDIREVLLEDN